MILTRLVDTLLVLLLNSTKKGSKKLVLVFRDL